MDIKVNTLEEAWNFLYDEVYQNNKGEFRIHTNKKGIRLYIKFNNEKYTGRIYKYHTGLDRKYHPQLRKIIEKTYCDTLIGSDLVSVLNKHLKDMPGNILVDATWIKTWTTPFEGTVEEFLFQDLEQRKQLSKYTEELKKLKLLYPDNESSSL